MCTKHLVTFGEISHFQLLEQEQNTDLLLLGAFLLSGVGKDQEEEGEEEAAQVLGAEDGDTQCGSSHRKGLDLSSKC